VAKDDHGARMKAGTDEHKRRFCEDFIATHNPYQPEALPWPALDAEALARLRAIPFWAEVLTTERRAGAIVNAYAARIDDPLVRQAVALQAYEEARHARLLWLMARRYGVAVGDVRAEPPPPDLYRAFADFGYGECLDAFLGFGVFNIARRAAYLPEPLFAIFELLLHEENRHIVFFINWMAWEQARRGRGLAWLRAIIALRYYAGAIGRLVGTVRRGRHAADGRDFSPTQAAIFLDGFSLRKLLEECCAEYDRRMHAFDAQLLKPVFLPRLAGIVLAGLRLGMVGRGRR
jgi:hypothetical protein